MHEATQNISTFSKLDGVIHTQPQSRALYPLPLLLLRRDETGDRAYARRQSL